MKAAKELITGDRFSILSFDAYFNPRLSIVEVADISIEKDYISLKNVEDNRGEFPTLSISCVQEWIDCKQIVGLENGLIITKL